MLLLSPAQEHSLSQALYKGVKMERLLKNDIFFGLTTLPLNIKCKLFIKFDSHTHIKKCAIYRIFKAFLVDDEGNDLEEIILPTLHGKSLFFVYNSKNYDEGKVYDRNISLKTVLNKKNKKYSFLYTIGNVSLMKNELSDNFVPISSLISTKDYVLNINFFNQLTEFTQKHNSVKCYYEPDGLHFFFDGIEYIFMLGKYIYINSCIIIPFEKWKLEKIDSNIFLEIES